MASIKYQFKYMPLVGKLPGKSMAEQTEQAINEIAEIVNDNTAQAEIINTLAEEANANSVEALEKATEALETSGRVYIKETGAVDLDSYCESQLIYINNIFSQNLPVESKGFLEVKTNDDKTQATQVFIDDTNKEAYTRSGAITETIVGDVTTYTASYGAWNKSASTNYVENMVLIRQNSTAYSVGDIARSTSLASYMLLKCTSAGTTGASEPSFSGADVGDVITDGSVSWTLREFATLDSETVGDTDTPVYVTGGKVTSIGSTLFSKIVTHLASATAASISSLNTSSLFYRMLSWALTASGVQYNLTNSSSWYICFGSLLGGLIIQGGLGEISTLAGWANRIDFPISFSDFNNFNVLISGYGTTEMALSTNKQSKSYMLVRGDLFPNGSSAVKSFFWCALGW